MTDATLRKHLSLLGSGKTRYPSNYDPKILESFPSKNKNAQWVRLICPEFTSLCPLTAQPDFARILINYIPNKKMVESKSLKLYLFSFRNHGDFHEKCIETIASDLNKLLKPHYIEVIGEFTPRGGIAIHPCSAFHDSSAHYKKLFQHRQMNYQLR